MLLSLEPRSANALARMTTFFGFTTRLAEQRQRRLAAAIERVLDSLRVCGVDDAVFASRDGKPCFIDREGVPEDLGEIAEPAGGRPVDFQTLHLFARQSYREDQERSVDPYRGEGTHERNELELAVDVEIHRDVPFDGYPLRLRVHGLIKQLRARSGESWDELAERTGRYIRSAYPERRVHGHEDIPVEFTRRVDALALALTRNFGSDRLDRADRSVLVLPRRPREGSLEELPVPLGAGSFASLPGLEDPLRYLFAWPEVHAGMRYAQMLILDGQGRRMLATGQTELAANEDTLAPGSSPLHLPVPDLLAFSGHEWDAEARKELLLPKGARCEGLEGGAALINHERRKFECGARGPATATGIGGGSMFGGSGAGGGYPGGLSF